MRTPVKTKEDYIKENGRLREQLEVWEVKDKQIRENLTQIIRYYPSNDSYGYRSNVPSVMSWIDIAFHMGELRADANYSMLLKGREEMRREIESLKQITNSSLEK